MRTNPSTRPLTWLATSTTGPSGGSRSAPSTSSRRKKTRTRSLAAYGMTTSRLDRPTRARARPPAVRWPGGPCAVELFIVRSSMVG